MAVRVAVCNSRRYFNSGWTSCGLLIAFGMLASAQEWSDESLQKLEKSQCGKEVVSSDALQFVWESHDPQTEYAISEQNICWNSAARELVVRQCDVGSKRWRPESVACSPLPRHHNKFCPEDLIEIALSTDKFICITVTEHPHQFEAVRNLCYGSDALAQHLKATEALLLFEFLGRQKPSIAKFWLPAIRASDNKLNPFRVQLPGALWGDVYNKRLSMEDLLSDKHCLALTYTQQNGLQPEMTDCAEALHSVCVYRKHMVAAAGCPQGFAALSYRPDECYGIDWDAGLFPLDLRSLSLAEYFQRRNSLQRILKQTGISETDKYFSVSVVENADYAIKMNADEEIRIVAFDSGNNRGLSAETLNDKKSVEMTLKMDVDLEKLVLSVYNRHYIWRIGDDEKNYGIKCFTNADYEIWRGAKVKLMWENSPQTRSMFEVELRSDAPGYYWCEAHTILNFDLIVTPRVIASKMRSDQHTFVATIDVPCTTNFTYCADVFNRLKDISKAIKQMLKDEKATRQFKDQLDTLNLEEVHVMEILSIAPDKTSIKCLCHITVAEEWESSVEDWSDEIDDSLENVQTMDASTRLHLLHQSVSALVTKTFPEQENAVRSTQYCFRESFQPATGPENQWLTTKIGQTTTTKSLCLQYNGLPMVRKCEGNFLYGGYWEALAFSEIHCLSGVSANDITRDLFELVSSKVPKNAPAQTVRNVVNLLEHNLANLIPADVYYMARIMRTTTTSFVQPAGVDLSGGPLPALNTTPANFSPATAKATSDVVRVYNYLMQVNDSVIKPSIVLNATNILLEAFERLIDGVSADAQFYLPELQSNSNVAGAAANELIETIDYKDVGVVVKIVSNLVIFIIDPAVANISGVALFRDENPADTLGVLRGAFKNESYRFLLANQSVDDLLYEPELLLATYVPETLWNRLDEISIASNRTIAAVARIVIKVYSNDKLFQENRNHSDTMVFGKIVSVSIPGHDKHLPEMLPLILKVTPSTDNSSDEHACSYWNYKGWAHDGLVFLGRSEISNDLILCGATHLTPFAYLIGASFSVDYEYDYEDIGVIKEALDIITLFGCSLSLFGIGSIFITAALFQSWRQKPSSKLLLQLSAAIAFQMILFCFVNTEEHTQHLLEKGVHVSCIVIGACLQYSVLVEFCWMLIIAYMQFKRYVQVFESTRPKRFFIKSFLLGWGMPLVPTGLVLIFDRTSYTNWMICYPSGWSLYLGVLLPITLVIAANLVIFVCVIYSITRGPDRSLRYTERRLVISQIRLSVLLFFLLGFTWIFGILAMMRAGLVFSYLFCLTATMQGFVLFLYFIVLDPVTRRMWTRYVRRLLRLRETNFDTSTSMKDTTSHTQAFEATAPPYRADSKCTKSLTK